jgi:2-polyprenyl-6-methoxyphenol hydroxylase-like FAD-dependent oxidoreductase
MEHSRRLGFADEIRSLGLPEDFPTDIAYFTRYAKHELARFRLPSSREARERVSMLSGSWSAAELPHRVSQRLIEQVLRRKAESLAGISLNYGWRVGGFIEGGSSVTVNAATTDSSSRRDVVCSYLVAGDGARSTVRAALGIRYVGDAGAVRDFFGGRMLALYLRCPRFYEVVPFPPAWMNVTFNDERRAFMAAVDGKGEFAFHTQFRDDEDEVAISDELALDMFRAAVGIPVEAEILSRGTWTAGYALVADRYGRGRVLLGGDAVHLFTPAGGLGYNTAIDDAVNLGWKLAAVVKGVASPSILDTYQAERRPVAIRNTGYARSFADSIGLYWPQPGLEEDSERGARLRTDAGAYLEAHGKTEFDIPGITFGARYDGSPVIHSDPSYRAEETPNAYVPTAAPGGRAPHAWIDRDTSLYDLFGFEWTLLRTSEEGPRGEAFAAAAARIGMELEIVTVDRPDVAALYEETLVLIRPDQVVAWRGSDESTVEAVVETVLGYRMTDHLERT